MPADNTPAVEPLVRVYNKRAHHITVGSSKIAPQSFGTVPQSVASALMKQWPEGVVEAAVAQQEIGGAHAEANILRERVAALEKENTALKAAPASKKSGRSASTDVV